MARPSRDQIEQMAFMAMMDGIIHTNVPCNCATCKSDNKSRAGTRPQTAKRTASENSDKSKSAPKSESSGTCNHSIPESRSAQQGKKSSTQSPNKNANASNTNPARTDKVNALLKADNVQAVFDVFNLTSTSKEEKDLATRIQNATKDCKLYQETKDKILELCDDEEVALEAVFGLLTKFRYERNMLTTAVIKGNSEREKALLCIQRVDHLMYMLQDVAKKKDSKGNDVMHKLGDIIMEIHDLAKTPSTLYDEFLDIKEEHFDLLNDHEEMHQKFADVNSCHEKLHSSHDKLQAEHNKLLKDHAEMKKKASLIGGFKNDVTRLEKAMEKSNNENSELRKEVERLNAELAKVNALKHENAQLKKKVTTLSIQSPPPEEILSSPQAQANKKKKGKKALNDTPLKVATTELVSESDVRSSESDKVYEEQISKLKKAYENASQELEAVRLNLKQLNALVRKAESAKDQAVEKLEVEKATSSNWKDIAKGHGIERDRLQAEVERHLARATRLQSSVGALEQSLSLTRGELTEKAEAFKQVKEELDRRSPTPAVSISSHQTASLGPDTIRLLRKIKSETGQLARDLDDSRSFGGDIITLLEMIHLTVRRVAAEVERDIEEILSVKGSDPPIGNHNHIPETVLPFTYNVPSRHTPQFSPRPDYSPQESPQVPSSSLPPYRPMMPPPGFSEPSPMAFNHTNNHTYSLALDSPTAPFSRMVEPPGLSMGFNRTIEPPSAMNARYNAIATPSSSIHSHSPLHNNNVMPNPNVGVIGSKVTSSKINSTPSPNPTPATSGTSVSASSTSSTNGLGNGAVGVDWNMWAKSSR